MKIYLFFVFRDQKSCRDPKELDAQEKDLLKASLENVVSELNRDEGHRIVSSLTVPPSF